MKRWIYLLIVTGCLVSCYEDETIIPGTESEQYFTLPQGDHDYDDKIVEYFEKYNFYILYDFKPEDVYWTGTNWDEYLGSGNIGDRDNIGDDLFVAPALPDRAGELLDMCENLFFSYYPDSLLQRMPTEFFLCSRLCEIGMIFDPMLGYVSDSARINVYRNFHCMAVNGGSMEIDTMGRRMKMEFQQDVNSEFLTYLNEQGVFEMSEDFTDVCDYKYQNLRGEALFAAGYVSSSLVWNNVAQSKTRDFEAYLKMLAIPLEILEGEPAPIITYEEQNNPPLAGALNPKRDVNGLVRKKYEILIRYFKESYGIDTEGFQKPNI